MGLEENFDDPEDLFLGTFFVGWDFHGISVDTSTLGREFMGIYHRLDSMMVETILLAKLELLGIHTPYPSLVFSGRGEGGFGLHVAPYKYTHSYF